MTIRLLLATLLCLAASALAQTQPAPTAALFEDEIPGADPAGARLIFRAVQAAGYHVESIKADALINATPEEMKFDLLVLPNGRNIPVTSAPTITRFLESGGDLIVCGLPLWDAMLSRVDGKWLSRADYESAIATTKPQRIVIDFAREDLSKWKRATNSNEPAATYDAQDADQGKALHVVIPSLTGWDTLEREVTQPFEPGQTLTCFRAKGGPETQQLAVEWAEKDGSRWIATINLTPQWKSYVLTPDAFYPWQPPKQREHDHLHVENAAKFAVGLAFSHTDVTRGEPHEYWIADVGVARPPVEKTPQPSEVPALETLSPAYRVYPMSDVATLITPANQALVSPVKLPTTQPMLALHPRPGGAGLDKNRPWRWQPLLEARSHGGDYRGAVATLLVNSQAPYRGGVWAAFTPSDPEFYRQPEISRMINEIARAMRRGTFFVEAGSEFYTMLPQQQSLRSGARVANFGRGGAADLVVRTTLFRNGERKPAEQRDQPLVANQGETAKIEQLRRMPPWPAAGGTITVDLIDAGRVIDRISHELNVWRPPQDPHFIEARDGGFWLDGKPWKAHGVNYMPSSGVGQNDEKMFEHWIGAAAYDPEVIDRDLGRIKDIGLNAISVFMYRQSMEAQNLADLLRRCEQLGLHVNLSLRPGTPMDFPWDAVREMIVHDWLPTSDAVFAYDLAWEETHWDHEHQKQYLPQWTEWVKKRYGNLEQAELSWSVPAPREDGAFSVPPAQQLVEDGPWRKLIADYRAFLDELTGERYGKARESIHAIDPHHAVSFRMNIAGDPTARMPEMLAYDFWGLRDAVDIWGPEAYGRIGDWEQVKPGGFTRDYATLCDPNKPMMWAEMGLSVWDMLSISPRPDKLESQARFFNDFYRMMRESGADGIFFWWYPGGFRVNERSDFGIINPDGTDRPATKVIREQGPLFLEAAKPPPPDVWIKIDRDRDARGLYGIYQAVQKQYWDAIAAGHTPGLQWEKPPRTRP